MSLISDALRKAHLEAAQLDRTQRNFYMNHGGRSTRTSAATTRGTVILAAVMGGCVTAGAAVIYMARTLPEHPSARAREVVGVKPADAPAPALAPAVAPPPMTTDRPESRPPARKAIPAQRAERSEQPRPKPVPEKNAVPEQTVAAERQPEPAVVAAPPRRASRDQFVDGATYDSPIRGPFGTELILSGISSTRGGSLAIINGNLLRAGATVGPFVIEEIEPRRVRVRYVDVRFWLTH